MVLCRCTSRNTVNESLYLNGVAYLDIKAGKTQIIISPVFGFGTTNIKFTIDTTTQTASGKVLFWFVYGAK